LRIPVLNRNGQRSTDPARLRYALFFGWMLFTAILLLAPADTPGTQPIPQTTVAQIRHMLSSLVIWAEKDSSLWHAVWYFVLAGLAAFLPMRIFHPRKPLVILIALNMLSLSTEFLQGAFIPGRAFEWSDLAFNGLGIALGLIPVAIARMRNATLTGNSCRVHLC
jgi:hypothetical protein